MKHVKRIFMAIGIIYAACYILLMILFVCRNHLGKFTSTFQNLFTRISDIYGQSFAIGKECGERLMQVISSQEV